ncbi:ABC transporter permease [Marinimicrobium sp. C6131]|uniref:MlaE family ABC transporter permease n=1 Tax=Marinimicrobium sp. C6131 TaxID=3022676 RepID=UPI00223CE4CF|nr:ABC transporter permease [Marinimicrobium sp. C6131]UZJ44519.1 ABC transporter permease [Marinimicrobium sp. C6131]
MAAIPSQAGRVERTASGLRITGNWTLAHYRALQRYVAQSGPIATDTPIDLTGIDVVDTAGATLLAELIGAERLAQVANWASDLPPARQALLETIAATLCQPLAHEHKRPSSLTSALADIGRRTEALWHQQKLLLGFIGLTLITLVQNLPKPHRWRMTSLSAHLQQTGLDAVPIVALLTFLVGAVVAFLGATVLEEFGATIYTVNLVAYSFLREFGVLLAAILLAGRTASAFAAELGSMKANEEIDAIQSLGLKPVELLVIPRVIAMMIALPILTFVGMLSGIIGGMLVCLLKLDISMLQFVTILQRDIPAHHFLVGLSKAPVFAFVIAVIGCVEGFKVSGSAESVGEHTTSSVVQSIFMVILLNAVAALFFMEMGW